MPRNFILIAALIVFSAGFGTEVFAQSTQQKTEDLIAALGKTKYKKKDRGPVKFELYVDVKSEAVVKPSAADYAGVYQSTFADYRLELRVSPNGKVEGSGYDSGLGNSQNQHFTLRDARIEGALLTATKVFGDGKTEKLEAVFNNRTVVQGKNPNEIKTRETAYGLGFIESEGESTNRIFLEFKP
jgi:hypothetical protein